MPVCKSDSSPSFQLPFISVTGLAAPSRGARETCVWRLTLAPGAPPALHSVDREEIFVALTGRATAQLGEASFALAPGDTFIVPAGQAFSLANPGDDPFEAFVVLPVGGRAVMPGGEPFVPPWAG